MSDEFDTAVKNAYEKGTDYVTELSKFSQNLGDFEILVDRLQKRISEVHAAVEEYCGNARAIVKQFDGDYVEQAREDYSKLGKQDQASMVEDVEEVIQQFEAVLRHQESIPLREYLHSCAEAAEEVYRASDTLNEISI